MNESEMSLAFKVIDRRGEKREERKPTLPEPDILTAVRDTADPLVFVGVFPGNRVPEQQFKVSRLEAMGIKLYKSRGRGLGPVGQKAVHAIEQRILKLRYEARRVHEAAGNAPGPKGVQ